MKSYTVTVNGKAYAVTVEENVNGAPAIPAAPAPAALAAPAASAAPVSAAPANVSGTKVNSPMPGTVLKVNVANGASVKRGDVLCVLEAMKMENEITSPADGTVSYVISKGTSVQTGDLLVAIG